MRNAKQILPQYALKSRVAQYHSALRFVRSQGHLWTPRARNDCFSVYGNEKCKANFTTICSKVQNCSVPFGSKVCPQSRFVFRLGTNESQRSPAETAAEALDWWAWATPRFHIEYGSNPSPFHIQFEKTARNCWEANHSCKGVHKQYAACIVCHDGHCIWKDFEATYYCQGHSHRAYCSAQAPFLWQWYDILVPPGKCVLDGQRCNCVGWPSPLPTPHWECTTWCSTYYLLRFIPLPHDGLGCLWETRLRGWGRAHPRGCTAFCQPVDIRINKSCKNRLRNQWEDWMIEEGLANGTTSLPRRFDIVQWTRYAVANLSRQTLKVLVGGTVIKPCFHQPESNNKEQIWMPITTVIRIVIRNTVI